MITSQMNNPFAVGDLVHIPQGVCLFNSDYKLSIVTDKPVVALIVADNRLPYYTILLGDIEYLIEKQEMALLSRKEVK